MRGSVPIVTKWPDIRNEEAWEREGLAEGQSCLDARLLAPYLLISILT